MSTPLCSRLCYAGAAITSMSLLPISRFLRHKDIISRTTYLALNILAVLASTVAAYVWSRTVYTKDKKSDQHPTSYDELFQQFQKAKQNIQKDLVIQGVTLLTHSVELTFSKEGNVEKSIENLLSTYWNDDNPSFILIILFNIFSPLICKKDGKDKDIENANLLKEAINSILNFLREKGKTCSENVSHLLEEFHNQFGYLKAILFMCTYETILEERGISQASKAVKTAKELSLPLWKNFYSRMENILKEIELKHSFSSICLDDFYAICICWHYNFETYLIEESNVPFLEKALASKYTDELSSFVKDLGIAFLKEYLTEPFNQTEPFDRKCFLETKNKVMEKWTTIAKKENPVSLIMKNSFSNDAEKYYALSCLVLIRLSLQTEDEKKQFDRDFQKHLDDQNQAHTEIKSRLEALTKQPQICNLVKEFYFPENRTTSATNA